VFSLFDADGNGSITSKEFQRMLVRLQLADSLPTGQLAAVFARFDTDKKGTINVNDFKNFAEKGGYMAIAQGKVRHVYVCVYY
jgi:Ca2+-binding EF-hand superfamily protein